MRVSAHMMHTALPILAPFPVLRHLPVMVGESPPSTAPGKRVKQGQGGATMFASAEKHSHG